MGAGGRIASRQSRLAESDLAANDPATDPQKQVLEDLGKRAKGLGIKVKVTVIR